MKILALISRGLENASVSACLCLRVRIGIDFHVLMHTQVSLKEKSNVINMNDLRGRETMKSGGQLIRVACKSKILEHFIRAERRE